ncbi:fungal hydrophobin [Schizophyllum commune Loenen D]|nr:fungal hydrophobin [Schizophyllum commune Loenen D]
MRVVSLSVFIASSLLGVSALPSASGCNAEGTWCCNKKAIETDISGLIEKGCTPTSILGIGGTECQGQTVCCDKTDQNGILNAGCKPTILGV